MNKIKGSSSAVKMKYLLFVFAAAVLVALPTRVYQLLALVDASNGFYKESDVTIPVLYAVLMVFGVLFLVLSFVSKEVPSPKLPAGKNTLLGVSSFIMTAGLGYDMFKTLRELIPANQGNGAVFMGLLKNNLSENGGAFVLLSFVFAFFAMIYFIVFGISHLNGKASYKEFKLLALSPLCWAMAHLVINLRNEISFIRVSELLFEIFMFVFVMLFLLTFARISSGVFTEDSMWGIYGYGLTASLLAAVVTVPRIVIALVGLDPVEGYEFDFAHLAILIFILTYVFASLGVGFKDGLKNRRTVNEIDLPEDFEAVIKKDDFGGFFSEDDEPEETEDTEEADETVETFAISVENEGFPEAEEDSEDTTVTDDDITSAAVEETEEATVEIAETIEETAPEIVEKVAVEEEETVEEDVPAVVEEKEDDSDDEMKIISLADLKKRKE
ncbi:MAG: hypothetical protein ACI4VW_02945 [Acutalibacteraceae bacterium]